MTLPLCVDPGIHLQAVRWKGGCRGHCDRWQRWQRPASQGALGTRSLTESGDHSHEKDLGADGALGGSDAVCDF